MDKVVTSDKDMYPRNIPLVKMNLRYKPMEVVTKAPHYYKYVPSVFTDAINFDFTETDYQLLGRDKDFLKDLNAKIAAGNGTIPTNVAGQTVKQE